MPVIEPTSFDEGVEFIQLHRDDIKRRVYDVRIQAAWVSRLAPIDLMLLADYCESSKECNSLSYQHRASVDLPCRWTPAYPR